jgi:hypothetical protein
VINTTKNTLIIWRRKNSPLWRADRFNTPNSVDEMLASIIRGYDIETALIIPVVDPGIECRGGVEWYNAYLPRNFQVECDDQCEAIDTFGGVDTFTDDQTAEPINMCKTNTRFQTDWHQYNNNVYCDADIIKFGSTERIVIDDLPYSYVYVNANNECVAIDRDVRKVYIKILEYLDEKYNRYDKNFIWPVMFTLSDVADAIEQFYIDNEINAIGNEYTKQTLYNHAQYCIAFMRHHKIIKSYKDNLSKAYNNDCRYYFISASINTALDEKYTNNWL